MKPKLRFKEFTDDWEEKKLGEIADVTKLAGFEFTKYVIYSDSGNIIALRGLNIKKGRLILDDIKYIDMSDLSKLTRSKLYIGDIIFTYVGTIGECAVINENDKYYLAPNVCLIRVNNDNYKFVQQYISRDKFKSIEVNKRLTITSQPALSMNSIRQFKIQLPSIPEQEKIGTFFSLVDQRIEKQERKIALLEEEKKGYMQQIFNQELRFKDEEGNNYPDWEEKKLGDLIDIQMCKRILKAQTNTVKGIPFYKIGTLGKEADAFISKDLFLEYKKKYNYPKINEVMMTCSGTVGKTFIFDGKPSYYQDSNIVWLSNDEETVLNKFLYFNLNNINWNFLTSSTITRIYANDIYSLLINIPSLPEQEKIANFLSLLDQRIEKEQEKLHLLKQEKKGLLQQMFV